MTPESEHPKSPSDDRGVFGNLPSARPGVRSPRRDGGKRQSQAKSPQKSATAKQPAKPCSESASRRTPEPAAPPPRRTSGEPSAGAPPERPEPAAPEPASGGRGVEDVAWAGITVAAEAATLGVRLFSRALEAMRERR